MIEKFLNLQGDLAEQKAAMKLLYVCIIIDLVHCDNSWI